MRCHCKTKAGIQCKKTFSDLNQKFCHLHSNCTNPIDEKSNKKATKERTEKKEEKKKLSKEEEIIKKKNFLNNK